MATVKQSKKEIENIRDEFFSNIKEKSSKEIKKIKRLAGSKRVRLGDFKKLFCAECMNPYLGNEKIRITKGFRVITCDTCGKIKRIKL